MNQVPVQDLDIIGLLTRPGTYVLGLIIFIVTLFVRRIVENVWPSLKKKADENAKIPTYLTPMARWWNTIILAALPVALGAVSSLLKSDFFFDGIGDKGGRVAFGGCVGWFAGFLYQALKRAIKQKFGLDITPAGDSEAPPPMPSRSE